MSSWTIPSPIHAPGRGYTTQRPVARKQSYESLAFGLVWLLAFAIPWGDMFLLPYEVQASRLLTIIVAVVWFAVLWRRRGVRPLEPAQWWMLLFLLWAGAMAISAQEPERTLRRTLSYCQLFLDVWLIHQCATTWQRYRRLLLALVLGCFVALGGEMLAFFGDVTMGDGRYTAHGFDPNDLAVSLVLGIPIAWNLSLEKGRFRWLTRIYTLCAVGGCLLTASRGALVTLCVALLFPLLSLRRSSARLAGFGLIILVSTGLLLSLSLNDGWARRLSTITDQLAARDLNGRVEIWRRGFDAFQQHPIAGVGGGSFGFAVGGRKGSDLAAHNTMLGIVVEHGLVGLALFSGIVLSLYRRVWRLPKAESLCWLVVLSAWSIGVMSLSWENREITWLIWGLCLACPLPVVYRRPIVGGLHAR